MNNSSSYYTGRSGGSWEYTMGVFANSDGELYSGYDKYDLNSGFSGRVYVDNLEYVGVDFPNSKYYDKYTAYSGTTIDQYTSCNGGPSYALNYKTPIEYRTQLGFN